MNGAADLAPLIGAAQGTAPDVGFRQATVIAWDAAAGTNAVEIGGTVVRNLPVLNLGDFTILQPGDVVGLLRYRTTYFILGRVIPPSQPDASRAAYDYDAAGVSQQNFAIASGGTSLAAATINPPTWAGEVMIHATTDASFTNTTAAMQYVYLSVRWESVNGSWGGGENFVQLDPGQWGHLAASAIVNLPRSSFTGGSFTVRANMRASASLDAHAANICNVNTSLVYRRV